MTTPAIPTVVINPADSALCAHCSDVVFSRETWQKMWAVQRYQSNPGYVCSRSRDDIQESMNTGCWMCTHIFKETCKAISMAERTTALWRFGYTLASPVVGEPRKVNMLNVKVVVPAKPWSRTITVECPIYALPNTPEAEVIMAPDLDAYGIPNPLPDRIRTWFEGCRSHHDACAELRSVELPSRLLDTRPNIDNPEAVCLHVSQKGETGEYAALSYCWGDVKDRFVVTAATLEASTQKFEWSSLHKTYQHAIMVCRKLKIRYLWIDAVCILQDKNDVDKAAEMPRMHQYYKNAAVVISATDATHADAGFLFDSENSIARGVSSRENTLWHHTRKVQGWDSAGTPIPLNICTGFDIYKPEGLAVETRAWTLQERLLGTRVLHFMSNGSMLMVCDRGTTHNELVVFETFYPPKDFIHRMYQGDMPFYDSFLPAMSPESAEDHHVFGSWVRLVGTYGARKMTMSSDKLVAFASLAEEYYLKHGDLLGEYHAGVWSKKLPVGLCWKTLQQPLVSVPYRAPSWSWASVDTAYYAIGDDVETHPDFALSNIEFSVQPKIIGFHFGPVLSAKLKLHGRCREVNWRAQLKNTKQHKVVLVEFDGTANVIAEVDRSVDIPTEEGETVLLLALGRRPDTDSENTDELTIVCLVLRVIAKGIYQRVGFVSACPVLKSEMSQWPFMALEIE